MHNHCLKTNKGISEKTYNDLNLNIVWKEGIWCRTTAFQEGTGVLPPTIQSPGGSNARRATARADAVNSVPAVTKYQAEVLLTVREP